MFNGLIGRKSLGLTVLVFVILLVLPFFLPRFYVYLVAVILVTGLLATSCNLALGFGGIYQLHHAVFYGVGAYTAALMVTKTALPVWMGYLAAPFVAGLVSLVMGIICVRLSKLYFGMLQLSLGSLVWAIVFRWYSFTGGDDGIHGIPLPEMISSGRGSYYFTLIVTTVCLILMFLIISSPFGRALQAIRDNPTRGEAIGVDVKRHQLTALVIAGFFAGVAGSLFMTVEGSVFPDLLFWTLSMELVVMCLLGGWFSFLGPMLGAGIMVTLRTVVGIYTEYWTMVLGIVLMLLIFFLPEGALGYFLAKVRARAGRALSEEG
ncbi:MAG: branched-chain amino acid ABC transporter permease [Desulfatiglandales bacterium]